MNPAVCRHTHIDVCVCLCPYVTKAEHLKIPCLAAAALVTARTRCHSELHTLWFKVRSATRYCPSPTRTHSPPLTLPSPKTTRALEWAHPCSVPKETPPARGRTHTDTVWAPIVLTCTVLVLTVHILYMHRINTTSVTCRGFWGFFGGGRVRNDTLGLISDCTPRTQKSPLNYGQGGI